MKINLSLPRPGFEPGLPRPQRGVLTTRRSRLEPLGEKKPFSRIFAESSNLPLVKKKTLCVCVCVCVFEVDGAQLGRGSTLLKCNVQTGTWCGEDCRLSRTFETNNQTCQTSFQQAYRRQYERGRSLSLNIQADLIKQLETKSACPTGNSRGGFLEICL